MTEDRSGTKLVLMHLLRNKKLLIGIVVVIVTVFVAVFAFALPRVQEQTAEQAFDATVSKADELDMNGDYKGKAQVYKDYLAKNPDGEEVSGVMIQAATASINAGDYPAAIKYYEDAAKADPTKKLASLHGLSTVYIAQGDKAKAIEYLRQAIAEMKANGEGDMSMEIESDEAAIRGLEK